MYLCLSYKNKVLLYTPVSSEREFFKYLNELESSIDGIALCSLFENTIIKFQRYIGKAPDTVINPQNGVKYPFYYFLSHLHEFPLTSLMMYYNFHKLPMVKHKLYGFF